MADPEYWIADGGTLRPLSMEEVLPLLPSKTTAWNLPVDENGVCQFAKDIQEIFGISSNGEITSKMVQWWVNFRSFASQYFPYQNDAKLNTAYHHLQLLLSVYD